VRNYIEEGRSLRIVLSIFDKSLRDEIETYYQHCLEDADSPFTVSNSGEMWI